MQTQGSGPLKWAGDRLRLVQELLQRWRFLEKLPQAPY